MHPRGFLNRILIKKRDDYRQRIETLRGRLASRHPKDSARPADLAGAIELYAALLATIERHFPATPSLQPRAPGERLADERQAGDLASEVLL